LSFVRCEVSFLSHCGMSTQQLHTYIDVFAVQLQNLGYNGENIIIPLLFLLIICLIILHKFSRFFTTNHHASSTTFSSAIPLVIPRHIALIPDGNRRWSRSTFGGDATAGHAKSGDTLTNLVDWCQDRGVKELSVYGWSSENWSRPEDEIQHCMQQLEQTIGEWIEKKDTSNVAYYFVSSSIHKLPTSLREKMQTLHELTQKNSALTVYIYLSYGFLEDLGNIKDGIRFKELSAVPKTASNPDLLIRTGGEQRLSNFIMGHLVYTELCFINHLFPECDSKVWDDCIKQFSQRKRRFGK